MTNITPEEQTILDQAKLIAEKANPESEDKKDENGEWGDENYEKRFKDTQSAFTKAQQDKVEMATMLVEDNPANVERIPDEKVRAKVLQAKWGVDTMEELNAMFPDYKKAQTDGDEDDELSEVAKLQQTVKLMQFQWIKTKTNEEIANLINNNKDVVATISDFESKIREQMKNISETVLPKDRIDMAFKLVLWANSSSAGAYGAMQWITGFSASKDIKPEEKKITSSMVTDIMSKRRM